MPEEPKKSANLGPRFEEALVYATRLHAGQGRKRSGVPYIAHLLGVTALVLEDGGDEDEAIAALLHDAVEDQGGLETLEEIRRRFGEHVADIVAACTDAFSTPKPPWRQRKEEYIARMRTAEPAALRVSLADKLHNARATLRDLSREGEGVWRRFNGGKDGTLWYYRQLIDAFSLHGERYLLDMLKRTVAEMELLAGSARSDES